MNESQLFRPEALDAQRADWYGKIIMTRPVSYSVLTLAAAALALGLVVFSVLGTYTKRATVAGQLVPSEGLVKVYAQQPGIVQARHVLEGQRIRRGDLLFVMTSERHSSTVGDTQAAITREVQNRERSLSEQLAHAAQMEKYEHLSLEHKLSDLRAELTKLQTLIDEQRARYELAQADYARYEAVEQKGYVSRDQLTQRQADVMDQKTRLGTLERDEISTQRNLVDVQYQLATLSLKYTDQMGDIHRNIATAKQDLSESEARRELIVVAPEDGTATAITVHIGQLVDANKPLVSIVPAGSTLYAELYAPTRAIGFVRRGDAVKVRFQAFPYQKFGQYRGTVVEVASTALSSAELTGTAGFATQGTEGNEPLYRIKVALEAQSITAYGRPRPLQNGMLLEADVLQETRRLYEWVLEPLYTLSGKL